MSNIAIAMEECIIALGRRTVVQQTDLFVLAEDMPRSDGHIFYTWLNRLLEQACFDACIEKRYTSQWASLEQQSMVVQIQDAESLLFFLQCLTDQRMLHEQGPFDHPSINIPNGFEGNDPTKETVLTIGEVGTNGGTAPSQFPSKK